MTSILTRGPARHAETAFYDVQYNNADVTYLIDGSYIIVWAQTAYEFSNGVFYQHFNADGTARAAAVNLGAASDVEGNPSVTALVNGGFAISWLATASRNMVFQSYDADDNSAGSVSYGSGWDETASATLTSGYYVELATHPVDDGTATKGLYLTIETSGGGFLFYQKINTSGNAAINPSAAGLSDGNIIAVWSEVAPESGTNAIYERIIDSNGSFVTNVLALETPPSTAAIRPSVAALDNGYVVVWQQTSATGDQDVYAQLVANDGTPEGTQFLVSTVTAGDQSSPQVAALDDGSFAVVWTSPDADGTGIYVRRFDSQGHAFGPEELVDTTAVGNQDFAQIAAMAGGGFLVTWSNLSGNEQGLSSRAYTPATNLNGTQYVYGTSDPDTLDGGAGGDVMYGGYGDDIYVVNSAGDVVNEDANAGDDTVQSLISYTLGANVENLTLLGSAALNGTGNSLNNVILGNSGANVLNGAGGNDTINGGDGNDTINGGTGNDVINGGNGNDTVMASDGWDYASGDSGLDTYNASSGTGTAVIDLGAGKASQHGYTTYIDSFENAVGTAGNDIIKGTAGDNVINGGAGADTMSGSYGDDTYYVDNAGDVINEVPNDTGGTDTVFSSVTFSLSGQFLEILTLTGAADINATGNGLNNTLTGNSGNNVLDGGLGADSMAGGAGNDTYYVDNAGDTVTEASGAGIDLVYSSVSFNLSGQFIENLTLTGSGNINATGNNQANVLTGNSGNNIIDGGIGADTMAGGAGNDTYYVDSAGDIVQEASGQGTDLVNSSISFSLAGQQIENLTLTGIGNVNATGNGLANVLTGNGGNNTLDGGYGNDTLWGLGGADVFLFNGASGADTVSDFSSVQGDTINIHAYTHGTANTTILTQVGADVQINLGGGNVVTVLNTTNDATFQSHIVW